MDDETLEIFTKRLFEDSPEEISVVFQGGEPTLMGIPFYEKFMQYACRYNRCGAALDISIQTNGILLDDKWCEFCRRNNILVGLSFDGCPEVNDANRVAYDGTGVSSQAVRAIRLMQKHGVEFNVLMVVTKQAASRPKECYEYLKSIGVQYLQIIPALDPFGQGNLDFSLTGEGLGRFLCGLFDAWYADFIRQRGLRVTYFENIIYKLMGNFFTMCSMNGRCCIETVVEADGSVYPCDFYVSDEWKLGNIREQDFKSMIFSDKAKSYVRGSVHRGDACSSCPYFGLCIGSCRRYRDGRDGGRFCTAFKTFFDRSIYRMRELAQRLSAQ